MSDRWLAGIGIGLMGIGLSLGGTTRYVWHRWGPATHHYAIVAAFVALSAALVLGALSGLAVGLTAAGVAAVALVWAGRNYWAFRRDGRQVLDSVVAIQSDVTHA